MTRSKLFRKLVTRPVWWWERHMWPLSSIDLRGFPPLRPTGPVVPLVVLTTPGNMIEGAIAAWSWLRVLPNAAPRLVVDGHVDSENRAAIKRILPDAEVTSLSDIQITLSPKLNCITQFLASRSTAGTRLLRKLGLLHALSAESSFLYADYDVIAFNDPSEIREAIEGSRGPRFNAQSADSGVFDAYILNEAGKLGVTPFPGFNSGFLWIPRGALDENLTSDLLSQMPEREDDYFVEQTVLGCLMSASSATPLPLEHYVVNLQRQFVFERDVNYDEIAMRHFIYPVRHLLYRRGIPKLRKLAARC